MESSGLRKMVWMMTMIMGLKVAKSELHYVGGSKYSWAPNVNFSEWSSHQHFYVGDWLYFGFDIYKYNVLEVNKTSYENCIETGFINNITKGGRDVFQLTEAKGYYFLSGRGFCWQGMKVAINVENPVPPTPPPETPKSGSNSDFGIQFNSALIMLISAWVWYFFN